MSEKEPSVFDRETVPDERARMFGDRDLDLVYFDCHKELLHVQRPNEWRVVCGARPILVKTAVGFLADRTLCPDCKERVSKS